METPPTRHATTPKPARPSRAAYQMRRAPFSMKGGVVPARVAGSRLFAARKAYGEGARLGERRRRYVDAAGARERASKLPA